MKKFLQRRKGFTLIELLIVIVIIGILSVGFAPTLLNAPKKARDGVRKGQIASIRQSVEAYALDLAKYPATGSGCIGDDPAKAPSTDIATYFQGSAVPTDKTSVDADCKGFGYKNDGTYYYISVKLETDKAGNSAVGAKDGKSDTAIADGNGGQYYLVRVKFI